VTSLFCSIFNTKTGNEFMRKLIIEQREKFVLRRKELTTSVLAAAEVIVDVGVHHPGVADVVLAIIPTPVATEMDPLPINPAEPDKSPTSIRRPLIPRCQPSWPITRPAVFSFVAGSQHFVHFFRIVALATAKNANSS